MVLRLAVAVFGLCLHAASQDPGPQGNDPFTLLRRASEDAPLVVAHRGASASSPENTLRAFRDAVQAGAHVVEFDVHQCKDGTWVCMHDATCDRTTDAVAVLGRKGVRVDEVDWPTMQRLDAGRWLDARFAGERVPTLEQALAAIWPAVPMIERKGGDAHALVHELRRLDVVDRVLVQAFDWEWLTAVHRAEPRLLLGALSGKECSPERLAELPKTGARVVHWDHRTLRVEDAAAIRELGHLLCIYTVDADVELLGATQLGCDLVTTNVPARMAELRRAGRLRRR